MRRLIDAVSVYDATAANEAIDDTFARFDVAAALDHVLMPTLRVVGEGWEHDPGAIAREHFATNAIRPRLIRLLRSPASREAPTCVAAAPEKEEHDLGVLASAVVAADAGWCVTFLGARTPTGALRRAIEATDASVALVGAVRRRPAQTFLDELARPLPCGLVLGGAGFREEDLHRVEGEVTRHVGRLRHPAHLVARGGLTARRPQREMRNLIRTCVWYSEMRPSSTTAEVSSTVSPSTPRRVLEASSSAFWAASRHDSVDTPTRSIVLITAMVAS